MENSLSGLLALEGSTAAREFVLHGSGAGAEGFGFGSVVGALLDDGVEEEGVAELDAGVAGALLLGFVPGLVLEEGGEGFFGDGAVGGGAFEVSGEGADFGAGDEGDGDGGSVGEGSSGAGDEVDSAVGIGFRFGEGSGAFAVDDEQEGEVVEGGGAGFELGLRGKADGEVDGLAAGGEGVGGAVLGVSEGELLAVGVEGGEELVDLLVGVRRELPEGEVDGGGDDGGGRVAVGDEGRVGGLPVGVDGGLAEEGGAGEGGDGGDVAGGVDVHLELDGAFDAGGAGFGGVGDGGEG